MEAAQLGEGAEGARLEVAQLQLPAPGEAEAGQLVVVRQGGGAQRPQLGTVGEVEAPELPQPSEGSAGQAGEVVVGQAQLLQPLQAGQLSGGDLKIFQYVKIF